MTRLSTLQAEKSGAARFVDRVRYVSCAIKRSRFQPGSLAMYGVLLTSCSGEIGQLDPGLLSLQLQPSAAVQLSRLEYTVSHEQGFVRSGPVAVGDHQTFSFQVDTLPPALGYEVTAYAEGVILESTEPTVCTGRGGFEIKSAQTTAVSMQLQCRGVPRTGTRIGDEVNRCPAAPAIEASPAATPVGTTVLLVSELPDDVDGPLPLELHWHSDSGLISSPAAARTQFRCTRAGVVSVKLTVSDGDPACDSLSASVFITCTDKSCVNLNMCPNSAVASPAGSNTSSGTAGRAPAIDQDAATGTSSQGASGVGGGVGSSVGPAGGGQIAGNGSTQSWPRRADSNNAPNQPTNRDRGAAGGGGRTSGDGPFGGWPRAGRAGSDLSRDVAGRPSALEAGASGADPLAGADAPVAGVGASAGNAGLAGTSGGATAGTSGVGEVAGTSGVGEVAGTGGVGEVAGTGGVGEVAGTSGVSEVAGSSGVDETAGASGSHHDGGASPSDPNALDAGMGAPVRTGDAGSGTGDGPPQ